MISTSSAVTLLVTYYALRCNEAQKVLCRAPIDEAEGIDSVIGCIKADLQLRCHLSSRLLAFSLRRVNRPLIFSSQNATLRSNTTTATHIVRGPTRTFHSTHSTILRSYNHNGFQALEARYHPRRRPRPPHHLPASSASCPSRSAA